MENIKLDNIRYIVAKYGRLHTLKRALKEFEAPSNVLRLAFPMPESGLVINDFDGVRDLLACAKTDVTQKIRDEIEALEKHLAEFEGRFVEYQNSRI